MTLKLVAAWLSITLAWFASVAGRVITASAVAGPVQSTSAPSGSNSNGKIAFERARGRNSWIYTINPNGNRARRISQDRGFSTAPSFSPDGTKIAYSRIGPGQSTWSTFVANLDGSSRKRLATRAYGPMWSPDGTKIAFTRQRGDFDSDIFVINPDGSSQTGLTSADGEDFDPEWSPDSSRIAFVSGRTNPADIFVMDAEGTEETQLTSGASTPDYSPKWSPDGARILFVRDRTRGSPSADIFTMHPNGSDKLNLTDDPGFESTPEWSPDSTEVVYSRFRRRAEQIYVISADGLARERLTSTRRGNFWPEWSPDGTQIAFISARKGNDELFVMGSDGSSQTRLTSSQGIELAPAWQSLP